MAISDKTIIDAMGRDKNILYLFAYVDKVFDNDFDLLFALQDKLDTYMYYILDEQYKKSYKNIDKFRIIVEFEKEIEENTFKFFDLINKKIKDELKRKNVKKDVFVSYQYKK